MVSFAQGLGTTIARPPTPPKDSTSRLSNDDLTSFAVNAPRCPLLDTPEESPSSSTEYFKSSSEKLQKKVNFSPWTEYHRPLGTSGKELESEGHVRRLPPSKECKSSTKSILRNSTDTAMVALSDDLLAFDQTSLPAMLRSTTLHLASSSRPSRLDAYSTLLACLSAYDDIPNTQDLSEKVVEITGYIRRDITTTVAEDSTLDIQLATQALKVLTVFVCTPSLATILPEDFCSFIFERSVSSVEEVGSPKIVVSHYMHLLEKQKLGAKHMTTERVNRLITALDGITNRIKSNRIVGHRLMIYQRLITQAKSVMVSRAGLWIDHLVSGMLSTLRDVRTRAIAFGMEAGLHLGTTSSVTQAWLEFFNRESSEGRKVIDFLLPRLIEMSKSKEDGVHVPQIWSVVILFFRSRRRQLECWEHMKAWLGLIQRSFNSNDARIKFQAHIAWTRLIFAIDLDNSTCESMVKTLRQPIVSSLERKDSDKTSKQAKQIARSSYCTLLYYALRPAATHAQLDKYWDLYVSQILQSCLTASKTEVTYACDVLVALLAGNGKPKVWDENRANANGPIKPEELPCLDPKWVRLRTANILQVFDKMFDIADWPKGKDQEGPMMLAWRSFMIALGNAGSKEVKVSMETMNAIANIINGIKRLLERNRGKVRDHEQDGSSDVTEQLDRFEIIRILVDQAVAKIGHIPFVERRVILTSLNSFEAAETPSNRLARDAGSVDSPVVHLLSLLLKNIQESDIRTSYLAILEMVMHIPLQSAVSRTSQLSILRNLARLLPAQNAFNNEASLVFWELLADASSRAMKLPPQPASRNGSPLYPGNEYREAVKILELGIQQTSINISAWCELYGCICTTLREEIGNEAVVLLVTEPLADILHQKTKDCNDFYLTYAVSILESAHWPETPHQVERAQRLLWGLGHASHGGNPLDPFDNLYLMLDSLLSNAYDCLSSLSPQNVVAFASAITATLRSCPLALQPTMLSRIQHGVGAWIEDPKELLSASSSSPFQNLLAVVKELLSIVVSALESLPSYSISSLAKYENLILSGFKSRHKSIVNDTLSMWNRTFGCADTLEYPKGLQTSLSKLKRVVHLQLPNFPETEADEISSSPLHFVDSQGDEEIVPQRHAAASRETPLPGDPSPSAKELDKNGALSPNALAVRKSPQSARQIVETTPKAGLRHDDFQIHFAAVESSPLAPEPVDSQSLTNRQREFSERQSREAAAMFPDIRSSPRSASRPAEYSLPKLVLKSKEKHASRYSVNDETSPILAPDVLMDDFLGSSPTPNSSKKGGKDQSFDDNPPLSSPVAPRLKTNHSVAVGPAKSGNTGEVTGHIRNRSNSMAFAEPPGTEGFSAANGEREVIKEVTNLLNRDVKAPPAKVARVQPHHRILPDFDVSVGALAEPMTEYPASEHDSTEASRITNSFQSEGSSHHPTEDDQMITLQLEMEIQRSSSQQSRAQQEPSKPSSRSNRKRENAFDHPPSANKKSRHTAGLGAQQKVLLTKKPGRMVAECVMIDPRPVDGDHVLIKRERSPSTSFITATQFEEEAAQSIRRPGRPRRKPMASQQSQEASSARKCSRQVQVKVEDAKGTPALPSNTYRISRRGEFSTDNPFTTTDSPFVDVTAAMTEALNNALRNPSKRNTCGKRRQHHSHGTSGGHGTSLDTDPVAPATDGDNAASAVKGSHVPPPTYQQGEQLPPCQKSQIPTNNQTVAFQKGADAPADDRAIVPTAQEILQGFKDILLNIQRITLGPEEERAMVGILFESVKEVHEAGRRNTAV